MKYIVQKEFSFAGDRYFAGDTFDPLRYPFTCSTGKIAALVKARKIKEDFKLSGRDLSRHEVDEGEAMIVDDGASHDEPGEEFEDDAIATKPVRRK